MAGQVHYQKEYEHWRQVSSEGEQEMHQEGGILVLLGTRRSHARKPARDRIPPRPLHLEAFSEEHLEQRLIRNIVLVGQKLELSSMKSRRRSEIVEVDGRRFARTVGFASLQSR